MKNAVAQYDQTVFINGIKLKGVSAVDGSYNHQFKPLNVLSQGVVKSILAGIPEANFSITRNVGFIDVLNPFNSTSITAFGANSVRGSLNYGTKVFGFETGYLSSYSYSASLNDFPQSNVGIKVFGDIGSGLYITDSNIQNLNQPGTLNATGSNFDSADFPIYAANILLNCRGASTNRVTSFSVSANVPHHEIYAVNQTVPLQVSPKYPIEVLASITLEADDYEVKRMSDALKTGIVDTFSIAVYGTVYRDVALVGNVVDSNVLSSSDLLAGDSTPLFLYTAGNRNLKLFDFNSSASTTRLVSEQVSATAEDVVTVKLDYITYINSTDSNKVSNFNQAIYQLEKAVSINSEFLISTDVV